MEQKYKVHRLDGSTRRYKAIELPRVVQVGAGALKGVSDVMKQLGLSGSVVGVCDSTTMAIAGKPVVESLKDAGIEGELITISDATESEVERVASFIGDVRASVVLGIGGGRSIDVAKLSSFKSGLPYISIPTAASHDGIISSRASITSEGVKKSFEASTPLALVADTEIIAHAPHRLLAAGCGDAISNTTAVLDWELAHRLKNVQISSIALTLSRMGAHMILENASNIKPGHEPSAKLVIKALFSSGVAMEMAGNTSPASGSEHLFSHALDMIADKPALHGEQCGVGAIMMMYLHGGNWKSIKKALIAIGAPTTAEELGIPEDIIIRAMVMAQHIRPERYTILSGGLTEEAARNIARRTGVIKGGESDIPYD